MQKKLINNQITRDSIRSLGKVTKYEGKHNPHNLNDLYFHKIHQLYLSIKRKAT